MQILVILFLLLFVVVFGAGGVAQIVGSFRRRNWEPFEGKVCGNTKTRGDEDGPCYRPEIGFEVDGETVRFSPEDYRARSEAEIGERRIVLRDPATGECWESGGGRVGFTVACLAVALFCLCAIWWLVRNPLGA